MAADKVPVKTAEGHAELGTRRLRLSQRHRTVLLLVDGHRTEAQIRELARKAGVPETCYDELLGLSLISEPDTVAPPAPADATQGEAKVSAPIPLVVVQDSLLPASRTLAPDSTRIDSVISGPPPPDSWLPPEDDEEEELSAPVDATLEQAREILLRLVRAEAPVAGSLTLLRLRRARSRADLIELIDEVEARVGKRRSLAVTQSLTSARQLLGPGLDSARSAA